MIGSVVFWTPLIRPDPDCAHHARLFSSPVTGDAGACSVPLRFAEPRSSDRLVPAPARAHPALAPVQPSTAPPRLLARHPKGSGPSGLMCASPLHSLPFAFFRFCLSPLSPPSVSPLCPLRRSRVACCARADPPTCHPSARAPPACASCARPPDLSAAEISVWNVRIDPETVLVILTTTRIPDRISRTGTVIC